MGRLNRLLAAICAGLERLTNGSPRGRTGPPAFNASDFAEFRFVMIFEMYVRGIFRDHFSESFTAAYVTDRNLEVGVL
jgi:hypothetical protein